MATKLSPVQRIFDKFDDELPPEFAKRILTIEFTEQERARYSELSEKAQLGQLTEDETTELDDLLIANDLLMILQSKARMALKTKPAA
jgi:hypothetical protein